MLSLSQLLIFVAIAVGLAVIATLAATFFTVEQRTTAIVQRLGKFVREAEPGLRVKIPFIDRVIAKVVERQYSDRGLFGGLASRASARSSRANERAEQLVDTLPPRLGSLLEATLDERRHEAAILRTLGEEEMAVYRKPYLEPGESRRPTLTWPRQIPIEGEPEDVVRIVEAYGAWLAGSDLPKLFVNARPGAILRGRQREFCRSWPNQEEVTVEGSHFIQEDSPDEIGRAIAGWHAKIA